MYHSQLTPRHPCNLIAETKLALRTVAAISRAMDCRYETAGDHYRQPQQASMSTHLNTCFVFHLQRRTHRRNTRLARLLSTFVHVPFTGAVAG
jgi:hypothetical protein